MSEFRIRALNEEDLTWFPRFIEDHWGAEIIVSRGKVHHASSLAGFVAFSDNDLSGVITYNISGNECEIVTLDSLKENSGIGSALIGHVKEKAISENCKRLWLITTNDNIHAYRFYQRRGFVITAIHCNALEHSRKLKPEIPYTGMEGLPLRDEIEFEMMFD
jgi:ribosomal protein S18 acetylase RimI-like enzyme